MRRAVRTNTSSIKLKNNLHKNRGIPYLFDSLLVLTILLLFLYPLFYGILNSIYYEGEFTGEFFVKLVSDSTFWNAIIITGLYVLLYTVGIMVIGFITALAIEVSEKSNLPGSKLFSSLLTLPYAIPDVVGSLIWLWMLNPRLGVVNYLLSLLGVSGLRWLTDKDLALISVTMVSIWRLFPMHTLIILAAFRTVPEELYEAADIDGASTIKQFFYITLPSIRNIMNFLVLLTIVWSFKRFTILWLLTRGGPMHATETLSLMIYKEAFQFFNKNYAAAAAVVLLIIVGTLSFFYVKFTKMQQSEEGGFV